MEEAVYGLLNGKFKFIHALHRDGNMIQWLLILLLACLPHYVNRRIVRKQLRQEAFQARAEILRSILNDISEDRR